MENYVESRSVPITLADGKPRRLFIGVNALIKLVELLGIAPSEFQSAMSGPGALQAMRAMLWAGLSHEDKALTIETVGNLIDPSRLVEVMEAISGALQLTFGKPSGEPKNAEAPDETPATIPISTVPAS